MANHYEAYRFARPNTNENLPEWVRNVPSNPYGYSTQAQQVATANPKYEQPLPYFTDPTFFQQVPQQTPQNVVGATRMSQHRGQDGGPGGNFADPLFNSSLNISNPLPTGSSHMLKKYSNF